MKKAPQQEPTISSMEFSRKATAVNDDNTSMSDEKERNNNRYGPSTATAQKKKTPPASLRHEDEFYLKSPFPWKLQQLLEDVTTDNNEHIISWVPEGNAFQIHKSSAFETEIMPQYFRQTKFKSFTRQLYMYGFMRIQAGYYRGAFFHPEFIRGDKRSIITMTRKKKADKQEKVPTLGPSALHSQIGDTYSASSNTRMMAQSDRLEVARLPNQQVHPLSMHDQQVQLHQLQRHTLSERPIAGSPYPAQKLPAASLPLGFASLQSDDKIKKRVQLPSSRSFVDEKIQQNRSSSSFTIPPLLLGNSMSNKYPMSSITDTQSWRKLDEYSSNMKDPSKISSPTAWMQTLIDSFLEEDNKGIAAMNASDTAISSFDLEPTPIEEMMNKSRKQMPPTMPQYMPRSQQGRF